MTPLISVIVPIYNVELYLRKCIDSILSQTYTNLEVILVDDGSPDNCGCLCNDYASTDSRIKVIHKDNGGLSSARNAGLEIASGDYIGFVDSDDYIDKDMYAVLYDALKQNNAEISMCDFLEFKDGNDIIPSITSIVHTNTNIEVLYSYHDQRYVKTVVCWNKLYRSSLFDGIRFPVGFINEDEFVTHKLIFKAKTVVMVERDMYFYRMTPGSIMQTPFSIKRLDTIKALKERIEFYEANELVELANLTKHAYALRLIEYFFSAKANTQLKMLTRQLRGEFCDNYRCFVKNPTPSRRAKLGLWLFRISPPLYKIICDCFLLRNT